MNYQVSPEVYFDSLSIAHKLDDFLDGFKQEEVHLFAYFAAILFHYSGNPVDDWKYQFTISSDGYPHSKPLSDAIDNNLQLGYFEDTGSFLIITGRGTDEFNRFKKLPRNRIRENFIDAACSTSMLIPYKETKNALLQDPNLVNALKKQHNPDWISFNNHKLKEITTALGAPSDALIIPAVSWIEFLLKNIDLGAKNA